MSGAINSGGPVGSLERIGDPFNALGLQQGAKVGIKSDNGALDQLGTENASLNDPMFTGAMTDYSKGGPLSDVYKNNYNQAQYDQLATGSNTGSRYATDQVQSNPILGQLFGDNGLMGKEIGKEQQLQNQGFQLQPEDMTQYGQTSGNIARMFGAQGNQASQDLANRGLASAPSGAAGAMFSGLAGNQNEMLAQAQQQIMQQRFQNTMQQIQQQQKMIGDLGQQAGSDINQQYGRQLSGAQQRRSGVENDASLLNSRNNGMNATNLAEGQFEQATQPLSMQSLMQGMTGSAGGAFGKGAGQAGATSMFGKNAAPKEEGAAGAAGAV